MQEFFAKGFVKDSGFPKEYLLPTGDVENIKKLYELMEKIRDTERFERLADYMAGHEGSRYLASVNHPFPKPSIINSAQPLILAVEAGKNLMSLKGAIMGLNNGADMVRMVMGNIDINRFYSIDVVAQSAKGLKAIIPDTKAECVLNYLSLNGSLRPEINRQVAATLDEVFGQKSALSDFSMAQTPVLN